MITLILEAHGQDASKYDFNIFIMTLEKLCKQKIIETGREYPNS